MKELEKILIDNKIKYEYGEYAGEKSIVIKKNKYKIEIYYNGKDYVSDLQKVPYTWGRMGSTTQKDILEDLKEYLKINIDKMQTTIFDFIRE